MALDVVVLNPPDFMTGDAVPVASLKTAPVKHTVTDTRVQQGDTSTKYGILFTLKDAANPVIWKLKAGFIEADVDAALEAVLAVVAEATTVSS